MYPEIAKLTLFSFIAGGFCLWYSYKKININRLIEDTATSKSRSAAEGFTEFQGYAWPMSLTYKCSLSRDCVYYHIALQKFVKRGKHSSWETVETLGLNTDFVLLDSTGAVQISVAEADLQIENRTTDWRNLSEESKKFLLNETFAKVSISGFPPVTGLLGLFGSSFRIVENFILQASPLLVLGEFQGLPSVKTVPPTPGLVLFFDKVQTDPRLKIGVSSQYFDLDKNGKVDLNEQRRGLFYYAHSLIQNPNAQPSSTAAQQVPLYGIIKKSDSHDLVVLDCHERALAESHGWLFYGLFVLGAALILFGVVLMTRTPSFGYPS